MPPRKVHTRLNEWVKSPYSIEANPWTSQKELEQALLCRGAILAAYGWIETRAGEVALRASRLEEYASLRQSFPFSADKRITYLRQIFSTGPLSAYQSLASLIFDRFSNSARLRHMMAHGRMQVIGTGITIYDFPSQNDEGAQYHRQPCTLTQLDAEARKAAKFCRLVERLHFKLNGTKILPPLEI